MGHGIIVLVILLMTATVSLVCGFSTPARASSIIKIPCGSALSALRPAANTTVELSRNCTYTDALTVTANNVNVTAYGSGNAPAIRKNTNGAAVSLYGSHDTVTDLALTGHRARYLELRRPADPGRTCGRR